MDLRKLLRSLRVSASPPLRLEELRAVPPPEDARGEAEIRAALEKHRWNVTRAAEELGMSRHALTRLIRKYGLRA